MSNIFNPSMRKQPKKIIDSIEITWTSFHTRKVSHVLHIILHLKNSKWKDDTHLYFSDREYSMKDLKKIEHEFKSMKAFFDEVEP
jgi:hypothetical protein